MAQSLISGTNPPNTAELWQQGRGYGRALGTAASGPWTRQALSAFHTNISWQPLTHGLPLSQSPLTVTPLDWQLSLCLSEQGGGGYLGAAITPVPLGHGMDGVGLCSRECQDLPQRWGDEEIEFS